MTSTKQAEVRVKLALRGETLEGLYAARFESVRLTWDAVLKMTGIDVSERTIRRWLEAGRR